MIKINTDNKLEEQDFSLFANGREYEQKSYEKLNIFIKEARPAKPLEQELFLL